MRIIFLRTSPTGQRTAGVIVHQAGRLTVDHAVQGCADELLRGVDPTDPAAVAAALRRAPQVYDGAYLRAQVEA